MRSGLAWLTICIVAGWPAIVVGEGGSLEGLLAVPYPTHLVAASGADRVVWVSNDRGVRDIWIASRDAAARRLTAYDGDDGRPLGGLRLTPSGDRVVWVRGGGPNRAGEHPNPTSDPAGAERSIWAMSTAGGEAWRLGSGGSPVVAPSGREVVFTRQGVLYQVPLDAAPPDEAVEARALFRARGTTRGATFSPDGRRLAFVSDRGDHSFIGVYDLENDSLRWLAPSVDRDDFPAFSPDGERLAFLRRDGALKDEVFSFLVTWPFRVMVADVASGVARPVWRSPETGGGFAQLYPDRPLRWAGDRLIFWSEHSGWMHVYSLSPEGGEPVDLTPGACEAEHVDVAAEPGWLVFSHNCDDPDRRRVARVGLTGGERLALSPADGIHTSPVVGGDGASVYMRSAGGRLPTGVARVDASGGGYERLETLPDGWLAELDPVEPRRVVLEAADGQRVSAQLFSRRDGDGEPGPGLVFLHGGPMRQMLLGWHYIGYYSRCYAFNQYMAGRGWTVLSLNFRSGIGYGQAFRLAAEQGPYGASEYQDVVAAGRFLAALPEVDARRIALWGGSYGGYLTALGLARDSDLFAAGVDLHGVHDWSFRATDFDEGGGWGLVGEAALELALASSPVADVERWRSPVLLVHGDDDRNVLFQQSTDLAVRLRRAGLEPEILVLPDEVHGFLRHESWLRVFAAAAEFLERHLGAAAG